MKSLQKRIVMKALAGFRAYKLRRSHKKLLIKNNILNKPVEGEKKWLTKWGTLGSTSPIFYRLFYHYIGNDNNIVPEDLSVNILEPILNPKRYAKYYGDKNIFDLLFPQGYLPKTLLRKMNGFYYNAEYNRLDLNDKKLQKLLSETNFTKIIIKPTVGGISGRGIKCFTKKNNKWELLVPNSEQTKEYIHNNLTIDYLNNEFGDDFIAQEFLEQHDLISYFCSTSVNTLRLTLYRSVKNDECVIPSAVLRIGHEGSIVDNAHAGGCFVGIDVNSGRLEHEVLDQYGQRYNYFNGIDFNKDQQIPSPLWDNVLSFAKSIGPYIPHCRLLALDLMIDKEGNPRLIEFNIEGFSVWFFQFTKTSVFGPYTDEIIEYCKKRKEKLEYRLLVRI